MLNLQRSEKSSLIATQSKHPSSSSIIIFQTHVSTYHIGKLQTGTKDKPLQWHHSPLLCLCYFLSCITCKNELVWVFFQQILLLYVGMMFASFPVIHLNSKSLQGVLPPMSWRKLLSSFIVFCPPWPCQSKFPLENSLL